MSIAAGFADAVRCVDCLARELGQTPERLVAHLEGALQSRECFGTAWDWAAGEERGRPDPCPWSAPRRSTPMPDPITPAPDSGTPAADSAWDAGDKGCGDLVLELRMRMKDLPPGHVLELTATDPGAPQDIPAWCSLTRHALLVARPPVYWIRRRPDD